MHHLLYQYRRASSTYPVGRDTIRGAALRVTSRHSRHQFPGEQWPTLVRLAYGWKYAYHQEPCSIRGKPGRIPPGATPRLLASERARCTEPGKHGIGCVAANPAGNDAEVRRGSSLSERGITKATLLALSGGSCEKWNISYED